MRRRFKDPGFWLWPKSFESETDFSLVERFQGETSTMSSHFHWKNTFFHHEKSLTLKVACWFPSFMADTFCTVFYVDTIPATVTTIIVALCIVGFIIAESIVNDWRIWTICISNQKHIISTWSLYVSLFCQTYFVYFMY